MRRPSERGEVKGLFWSVENKEESGKDLQSFGAYKKFREEGGGGCLGVG